MRSRIAAITDLCTTATKMAQGATPVAAGIGNTRKTGNKGMRHFSLAVVQETSGTGH